MTPFKETQGLPFSTLTSPFSPRALCSLTLKEKGGALQGSGKLLSETTSHRQQYFSEGVKMITVSFIAALGARGQIPKFHSRVTLQISQSQVGM